MSAGSKRNRPCECGSGKKTKLCCGKNPLAAVPAPAPSRVVPMPEREVKNAPGLIILLPSRGRVTVETSVSLGHTDGVPTMVVPMPRKGVVEARNELATLAPRIADKAPFVPRFGWFCLWVDDDAFWAPGTVLKMMKGLSIPGVDVLGGWFTGRAIHQAPKAYRMDGSYPKPGYEGDVNDGDLAEVARMGFHFVMHRIDVFEKVGPNPFSLDNGEPGEDLAFCKRVRDAGMRLWIHTGCPIAHIDDDGVAYLPGEGPMRVVGAELQRIDSIRKYGPEMDAVVEEVVQ